MFSSSSTSKPRPGRCINSHALSQARPAAATSRARSCVSQVNPSPIACHSTRSSNRVSAARSPVDQAPLMNCTTPHARPRPAMRSSRPNAAVLLPLPGPVWTISKPFSTVLDATSASCTALRFTIFAAWRASSSIYFTLMAMPATVNTTAPAPAASR